MLYLYIIVGIWTFIAFCWSVAFLVADGNTPSKLERLVRAAEDVGEAYKRSQQ